MTGGAGGAPAGRVTIPVTQGGTRPDPAGPG